MKKFSFFALVGIFLWTCLPTPASATGQFREPAPHYVVIGAFAIQKNAIRFTQRAQKDLQLSARFELNSNRNLYYVYVLTTQDLNVAVSEARRLRDETELKDTWVYRGSFTNDENGEDISSIDVNPTTSKEMFTVPTNDKKGEALSEAAETAGTEEPESQPDAPASKTSPGSVTTAAKTDENNSEFAGAGFYFKITRALDHDTLHGEVDVIDVDRVKKIGTYKGNVPVRVSSPGSNSGNVSVVCEVFGYRKAQRDINYHQPEGDGIERTGEGVVVPFELMRLQKGDIAVMFHVYFFKDAAIMRPESRYEVTSLLEMLQENPNYKIRIHGHTNGRSHGKIITPVKNSTSFFSLTNTSEGAGTAKKLSEERARLIKNFLIASGVAADRMDIKAWGGKRPIHDKHHSRAQENMRVEIEILQD